MSRIEQLISEIEEYIDSCKSQALSKSKIIVNKEEMEELLVELRMRIPDEITKYQKIISQQQTILNDARSQSDAMLSEAKAQADAMIAQATEQANSMVSQASEEANSMVAQANEQTTEMINEHEIMQRAYSHAEEVISQANMQGSIQYTDDMLRSLQTILNHTMDNAKGRFDAFMSSMQSSYDIVSANRNELSGGIVKEENAEAAAAVENQETQAD
mgnify:CR=1 FL=1